MGDTTPTTRPALAWGAATHAGQVREANEDDYVAEPFVFAVADGMGGHQAGEIASNLAIMTLRERLGAGARNLDVVVASVVEANASIFQAAHANAAQRGMGTTLTAVAVLNPDPDNDPDGRDGTTGAQLVVVNVGDSRTYLLRDGVLRRASIDHSYVQELVATGHITEAEARSHPRRNIVTRALGIEPTVRVDTWTLPLVRGDRYVLCSDGLVDEVPDREIADVVNGVADPQTAADELVAMANRHGGRDNVTVIIVDVLVGTDSTKVSGDLDAQLGWRDELGDDSGHGAPAVMIDADGGSAVAAPVVTTASTISQRVLGPSTKAAKPPRRRRLTVGTVLFFVALLAIVAGTVIIAVVATRKDGDQSPATVPSTIAAPTSTTAATTTTTTTSTTSTTTGGSTTTATTAVPLVVASTGP